MQSVHAVRVAVRRVAPGGEKEVHELDGAGAGTIELTRPLRTKLVGGEAVNLAKPVIAQVHGIATAAGCQGAGKKQKRLMKRQEQERRELQEKLKI